MAKKSIENRLKKLSVVNFLIQFLKQIKLPGLEGLSLYDLLSLYITGLIRGALTTRASAIAFSFFTAVFPFLLFVLIIIPYIPIADFKVEFLVFLESFLPPSTSDFFFNNIFDDIEQSQSGGLLPSVFVLSILLMGNGVNSVFTGFEGSYHKQLSRTIFKQYLYALGVALILSFIMIITIAVLGYFQIYVVQEIIEIFQRDVYKAEERAMLLTNGVQYVFFVIMVYLSTATLYYFGTREGKNFHFLSVGALFTTVLIILTSFLFGVYIENFSQYNKLYGSIGALLIMLLYLWLNSNILLLGFELNASLNRLRKRV